MFPARAGMSRMITLHALATFNVPRASGDEPVAAVVCKSPWTCSPRERG